MASARGQRLEKRRNESAEILFLRCLSTDRGIDDGETRQFLAQSFAHVSVVDSRSYSCMPCRERLPRRTANSRACSFDMKFAVIQFPGSNCDQDCVAGINSVAWRVRLRRLSALWCDRACLADYEGGDQRRAGRKTRARHVQRFPSSVRSRPAPGRAREEPLASFCLRDGHASGRSSGFAIHSRLFRRDAASNANCSRRRLLFC